MYFKWLIKNENIFLEILSNINNMESFFFMSFKYKCILYEYNIIFH